MKEIFVRLVDAEDKFLSDLRASENEIEPDELLRSAAIHWVDCLNANGASVSSDLDPQSQTLSGDDPDPSHGAQ